MAGPHALPTFAVPRPSPTGFGVTTDTKTPHSENAPTFAFGVSTPALGVTPPSQAPASVGAATFSAEAIRAATKNSPAAAGNDTATGGPTFSFGSPASSGLPSTGSAGATLVFSFGAAKSPAVRTDTAFTFGGSKATPLAKAVADTGAEIAAQPELEPEPEPESEPDTTS